jgi:hypothetical protein
LLLFSRKTAAMAFVSSHMRSKYALLASLFLVGCGSSGGGEEDGGHGSPYDDASMVDASSRADAAETSHESGLSEAGGSDGRARDSGAVDGESTAEAGADAETDAGSHAGPDAAGSDASDAAIDAASDAKADTGSGTEPDAETDGSEPDASSPPDAGTDSAAPDSSTPVDAGADATAPMDSSASEDAGSDAITSTTDAAGDGATAGDSSSGSPDAGPDSSGTTDGGSVTIGCGAGTGVQAGSPWPMTQRCPSRAAFSAAPSVVRTPAAVTWSATVSGLAGTSPAVAADGTIYVTGLDLYAITPNGKQKWVSLIGSTSGPAAIAADGTIVVMSEDENLRAIHPDGTPSWTCKLQSFADTYSAPAIAPDGTIYVINSSALFSVSSAGTLNWSQSRTFTSNVALGADGTIYVNDLQHLYAIHPNQVGAWTFPVPGDTISDPVVGPDGTIYVAAEGGHVDAVNPDGSSRWTKPIAAGVTQVELGPDGTVYAQGLDAKVYAFGSDGTPKWTHTLAWPADCGHFAIAADGTLYAACGASAGIAAIEAVDRTGTTRWSLIISSGDAFSDPALGADGTVYFGYSQLLAVSP